MCYVINGVLRLEIWFMYMQQDAEIKQLNWPTPENEQMWYDNCWIVNYYCIAAKMVLGIGIQTFHLQECGYSHGHDVACRLCCASHAAYNPLYVEIKKLQVYTWAKTMIQQSFMISKFA